MDLAKMREKLQNLSNKGTGHPALWKPPEGDTVIRLVPLAKNSDNPFQELHFHYLGGKTYLSPISYGEADPIKEFSDSLIGEGGLSKEEFKQAKKFSPALRTYVPIVVRGKEDEGVKFWAFGKSIYEQILKIIADADYGDITDVKSGHDIKVTFVPQEKSTKTPKFAETTIMVKPKPTPLTDNAELLKKLLREQPSLDDVYPRHSYDDLKEALSKFLNDGKTPAATNTSAATDDWETPATTSVSAQKSKEKTNLSADAIADFEAVFES